MHRDIPLGLLVESVITLGGLYLAALAMNWGVAYFSYASPADVAAMPLLGLVLGLYILITMPLGTAFSRWRERLADEYALQATGKGAAYASALTRLANQNLAEVAPNLGWSSCCTRTRPWGRGSRRRKITRAIINYGQ